MVSRCRIRKTSSRDTRRRSKTVKRDGKTACLRCHSDASCDDCHTRHIHPGIPEDTLRKLQQNLVDVE
jgi:hypothetical protein